MLVKIFHAKYCAANWQTALQEHFFQSLGGCHTPHTPPTVTPLSLSFEKLRSLDADVTEFQTIIQGVVN